MEFIIFALLLISLLRIVSWSGDCPCSIEDLGRVLMDLGRHSSFEYRNRGVLSDGYYDDALDSMNDQAVYLVLSDTRTASSRIISMFTKNRFNHISLSFDYRLSTTVSYNGGNNRYSPGLNPETVGDLLRTEDSAVLIYRLEVSKEQKMKILKMIRDIDDEGSSYNILGLVLNRSIRPNIMYCSQFVYGLLRDSGAQYFTVGDKGTVKPSDFIELDYRRDLQFCYEL